jgi:hypothetical protein
MDPKRIPEALAALAGDSAARGAFLNEPTNFLDGSFFITEAAGSEEQERCHDTLKWSQGKATSKSMAVLISELILMLPPTTAGGSGDDSEPAAGGGAGGADLAGIASMVVGAVDAMTTALTETLRVGIDEMKNKSTDLSEKHAASFNQMVGSLALTPSMPDTQREAAVVAFVLEIEQALAFMPDGHAASGP